MFVTFLLSSLLHELVMAIVSGKIRGYLFAMQMAQIPLIALGQVSGYISTSEKRFIR
jgi:sterol O-acyltransferase